MAISRRVSVCGPGRVAGRRKIHDENALKQSGEGMWRWVRLRSVRAGGWSGARSLGRVRETEGGYFKLSNTEDEFFWRSFREWWNEFMCVRRRITVVEGGCGLEVVEVKREKDEAEVLAC